jgi:Ca-activated chloride channel family protein
MLWLLLALPAAAAAYLAVLRRRRRNPLVFTNLGLVREAVGARAWRRHIPPALFLLALAIGLIAAARPSAVLTLPSTQRVIILAIDVSLSMRATDVEPNRIKAAQAAAKAFVEDLPPDVRIGIVSFAGTALLAQRPTNDRDELIAAIERLQLDRHTAIGSGIIMSLATLFPDDGLDIEAISMGGRPGRGVQEKSPAKAEPKGAKKAFQPVPPGSNTSSAIVLLTDGRRTTGPDPIAAARLAADRGIRVFTVGFGTAQGGMAAFEGYSIYMAFDEESLKAIADVTRAEYFHATTAAELKKIYEGLSSRLVLDREQTEISFLFAAAAIVLLLGAAALSLLWFNRSS